MSHLWNRYSERRPPMASILFVFVLWMKTEVPKIMEIFGGTKSSQTNETIQSLEEPGPCHFLLDTSLLYTPPVSPYTHTQTHKTPFHLAARPRLRSLDEALQALQVALLHRPMDDPRMVEWMEVQRPLPVISGGTWGPYKGPKINE